MVDQKIIVAIIMLVTHGHRNRSGRPGGCRTNNLTKQDFFMFHIISIITVVCGVSDAVVVWMCCWVAGARCGLDCVEPSGTAHPGVVAGRQLHCLGLEKERAHHQDTWQHVSCETTLHSFLFLAGIGSSRTVLHLMDISITIISWVGLGLEKAWGTVNKISYDLSYNCVKFIERSTYDSDLQRAKISLGNIVSKYTTLAPTILRFCKWIICKKSPAFCVRCFVN